MQQQRAKEKEPNPDQTGAQSRANKNEQDEREATSLGSRLGRRFHRDRRTASPMASAAAIAKDMAKKSAW
jgi:hypothetical protein